MQQSESQIIGQRAEDIFRYLRPKNWLVRSQKEIDFGVDFEIELLNENNASTGLIAKIQLKGSENLTYIENGKKISFQFDVDNAQYLIAEIQIPSYLIVCDNNTEKCYWASFKTDKKIKEDYLKAVENSQQTFNIHIDINNDFQLTAHDFFLDMESSLNFIVIDRMRKIKLNDYFNLSSQININDLRKSYAEQIEHIDLAELIDLEKNGEYKKIIEQAYKILNSDSKSVDLKYKTAVYRLHIMTQLLGNSTLSLNQRAGALDELYFDISETLAEVTKNTEENDLFRIKAEIWQHIANIKVLSKTILWKGLNMEMHKKEPDNLSAFWLLELSESLMKLNIQIIDEIDVLFNKVNLIYENKEYHNIIDFAFPIISSTTKYLLFLSNNSKEAFSLMENKVDKLLNFFLELMSIVSFEGKWNKYEGLFYTKVAHKCLYLENFDETEIKKYYNELIPYIEKVEDVDIKKNIKSHMEKFMLEQKEAKIQKNDDLIMDIELENELLREHMIAMGVDVDNPETEIDIAVVEALNALNPERVLKNCKNLYSFQALTSPVGSWLKLPTLGIKGLFCTKHGYQIQNVYLDNLWAFFKSQYCNKCKDKSSHNKNWKWTRKWQAEQAELHHNKLFPKDSF